MNNTLKDKHRSFSKLSSMHFIHRYCNHEHLNILVWGRYKNVYKVNVEDFDTYQIDSHTPLTSLEENKFWYATAVIKDSIFFFGGDKPVFTTTVQKYSLFTDTWFTANTDMCGRREQYIVCTLMDKVYIIGGCINYHYGYNDPLFPLKPLNSCLQFDSTTAKWKQVGEMNEERVNAACALFEGGIVVCGGNGGDGVLKRSVERYDHVADTWSYMPSMITSRRGHKLVSTRNKLFAIGGTRERWEFEMFDSTCGRFVSLHSLYNQIPYFDRLNYEAALSIEKTLVVISNTETLYYDVETGESLTNFCNITVDLQGISCVIVPRF